MSDARWLDVEDDVAAAEGHFRNAVALYAGGGFDEIGLAGYRDSMALMHALQSAHMSAETALRRILLILGEKPPSGEDRHQKLIGRLARPIDGQRPALLSPAVATDLDETRRMRDRATRSYGSFDPFKAGPSIEAAARLAASCANDVRRFRQAVDPVDDPKTPRSP